MKSKLVLLVISCLIFYYPAQAQVDSSWVKQMQDIEKQFSEFEKSVQKDFNDFVDKNDKQFSDFLKKAWKEVEMQNGILKKEEKPKPVEKPVIPVVEPTKVVQEPVVIVPVKEEVKVVPASTYVPIAPGIQKRTTNTVSKVNGNFLYYGTNVIVSYDPKLKIAFTEELLGEKIAAHWTALSESEHYPTVDDLLDVKKNLQLPDWGYLKLVEEFSKSLFPGDENSATVLTWFLMNKSRYKVRLAYSREKAYLLIPTPDVVYRTRYYTFDEVRFYLFDNNAPKVYTYEGDYPDAKIYMSLSIEQPIILHQTKITKQFSFEHEQKQYQYAIDFNKNLIDFYTDYPPTEVDVNFNAPLSDLTFRSILNNVQPLIAGKTKLQAANILLALAQKSFAYKTDQEQFGYEKYFFAEEVFYYPASDCEDRSVIFAKLSNTLLEREAIGLKYPGHMSTAIFMPELPKGDYIQENGVKYYVADATYENAPVGIAMSQFRAVNPKVIKTQMLRSLAPVDYLEQFKKQNTNVSIFSEGIKYTSDYHKIVSGTFSNSLSFGGKSISALGINTFVACFSPQGELKWMKAISSKDPNFPKELASEGDKIYLNGVFSKNIQVDGMSATSAATDHFVAVFDIADGKLNWVKALGLNEVKKQGDFIYAASLNNSGLVAGMMYYDRKDYFDNFGFKVYPNGSLAVSNSFFGSATNTEFAENKTQTFANAYTAAMQNAKTKSQNADFVAFSSLFTALRLINGELTGTQIMADISKINPQFKTTFDEYWKELQHWNKIEKDADLFVARRNGAEFQIYDLFFAGDFEFTVGEYSSGNVFLEVKNGAWFYMNSFKYKVNSILFDAKTGKMLVDYSQNHYKAEIDLKEL
jgi:hypothetical protein